MSTRPICFRDDGKELYWLDSRGRDKAAVVAQEMASGRTRLLAEDGKALTHFFQTADPTTLTHEGAAMLVKRLTAIERERRDLPVGAGAGADRRRVSRR